LTSPLFLCRMRRENLLQMNKDKLKLIVRNLELLVDSLKVEIYSDVDAQVEEYEGMSPPISDYDEIFND
jgi:hypothetical protein